MLPDKIVARLGITPEALEDPRQNVRLRRFLISVASYGLGGLLIAVGDGIGLWPHELLVGYATAAALINLPLYAVFRSGLNLKASEPSLTVPQMSAACLVALYIAYFAGPVRGLILIWLLVIFMFGLFRLGTTTLLKLAAGVLSGYATVISLLYRQQPDGFNLQQEIFQWLVLAGTLVWFSFMGGYLNDLRRRVRSSEARFRGLTNLSSDWYWEQDAQLRTSFLSDQPSAPARRFGGGGVGKILWERQNLLPVSGAWDEHRSTLEARRPFRDFECVSTDPDGVRHYFSLSGEPLFESTGAFLGYRGIGRNITERKHAELALTEARDAAQAANRAKADFLASMSHEIRTPMNAVIGLTHLALKRSVDDKQRDYLTKIDTAASLLMRIINDILDLSKVEAGKIEIESVDFDLNGLLTDVAMMAGIRASEKKLDFRLNASPDLPANLLGDPLRIAQILSNLCSNAVKFTHHGEIALTVRHRPHASGGVEVDFSVRDSGIGISKDQLAKLFVPFTQADGSIARKYGGTGLGLSISHRLVALMGGAISVQSEPGKGSLFEFSLVCKRSAKTVRATSPHDSRLKGKRILVVDDDESLLNVMRLRLEALEMRVDTALEARKGIETLVAASSAGDPFALVITDWRMPVMDGLEASARIRADKRIARQPVILLLSSMRDESLEERARGAGIDGVILKPVSPAKLAAELRERLRPASIDRDAPSPPDFTGLRLLLVEDDPVNQIVARSFLEFTAAEIVVADNGREAIEALAQGRFDLVFMDLQMPEMDGIEASREIRRNPAHANLPIVALTASVMAGDRERLIAAGMNDYIAKPVQAAALYELVDRWVTPEKDKEKRFGSNY